MDNYTLSEICYKNGFADGQAQPIYYATGPLEILKTASHDLEALKNEIKALPKATGWLLTIYCVIPNSWDEPTLVAEFVWDDNEKAYISRNIY